MSSSVDFSSKMRDWTVVNRCILKESMTRKNMVLDRQGST